MSDISRETTNANSVTELTPEERARIAAEEREDDKRASSGDHIPVDSSRVRSSDQGNSQMPDHESPKPVESTVDSDSPLAREASALAIRAIRAGVDPSHLLIPRTTLENAVVNEAGDVVAPDFSEDDIDEDYVEGYYEADYRELVGQETEDVEDLDDEDGVVRQSGNKTFTPDDDFIGLVGAKEVDGDVLPDDDDPLNGPIAA